MQNTLLQTTTVTDSLAPSSADTLMQAVSEGTWEYIGLESIARGDGFMIALVGILIVFISLTIISVLVRLLKIAVNRKKHTIGAPEGGETKPVTNGVSGEVVSAIAVALQMHLFELHDEERTIITIKRVSRPYSPWSSKLYSMRHFPGNQITKP